MWGDGRGQESNEKGIEGGGGERGDGRGWENECEEHRRGWRGEGGRKEDEKSIIKRIWYSQQHFCFSFMYVTVKKKTPALSSTYIHHSVFITLIAGIQSKNCVS